MIRRKLEAAREKGEPIAGAEEATLWEEAHEWGAERLASTIGDLKGFYVKSGQVISTRVDMFPEQYTEKLASLQDAVDPIPASVVKAVVRQDLLEGEPLKVMFKEFDDTPLGSASIAQVGLWGLFGRAEVMLVIRSILRATTFVHINNNRCIVLSSLTGGRWPSRCNAPRRSPSCAATLGT